MEENLDLAPDSKLRAERVSEPEAGMGVRNEQAMLDMPRANMSWLTSGRSPVRLPRDFPMTVFSSEARKAMAKATPVRVAMSLKLKSGRLTLKLSSWKGLKQSRVKLAVVVLRVNAMMDEAARQRAKLGKMGSFFMRAR